MAKKNNFSSGLRSREADLVAWALKSYKIGHLLNIYGVSGEVFRAENYNFAI